jgi:mono/diheme cytochrome c family protein
MTCPANPADRHPLARRLFVLVLLGLAVSAPAEVSLPGIAQAKLEPAAKGRLLLEELNCVACHRSTDEAKAASKQAPRLADVANRLNPHYLATFIRDPHAVKPGTTMPAPLAGLTESERTSAAEEISQFLLSTKTSLFAPEAPDAVAAAQGEKLFQARGCAACHSPRDAQGRETLAATSVPLGALEGKFSFRSLVDFLRQPHLSRPSLRMPDLRLPARELECIAHYLLRDTVVPGHLNYTMYRGQVWEGIGHEAVEPERAGLTADFTLANLDRIHHHLAVRFEGWINLPADGDYTFSLKANGATLTVDGKEVVALAPKDRRGPQAIEGKATLAAGWRKLRLDYYHTGREPSLAFNLAGPGFPRGPIPSTMLSVSDRPIAPFRAPMLDPTVVARGRERFAQLGCARCHDDLGVNSPEATPLAKLNPEQGCLAINASQGVRFALSAEQRGWIVAALRATPAPTASPEATLHGELARLNCLACHERRELGGIPPARNALFTGTAPALGDQGRLPPPLSDVGAKLTPAALEAALLQGHRQRPYVDAAMPQFGEANVRRLIALFAEVDHLETVKPPIIANLQESRNAGYEMVGSKGFSCIACHDFNGQKSAGAGALDLVNLTQRLQKNWFHLYMRSPQRFHPGIIMPNYWPGGQSLRPDVLGGDTDQQIEALWRYLETGKQAKNPAGLSRQSKELRVTDVAEIARGRSSIGYRGLAVGYPRRISLAFDTEEMALRQLWKGEFANVDLGSFQPRALDTMASLPAGVPFHRLKSLEDNWPAKGKTTFGFPQNLGYQFRGYDLDAARRPTFHYEYGEVKVDDRFEDMVDAAGVAFFRRTLRLTAPAGTTPFTFRVAAGTKVSATGQQAYAADKLRVRLIASPAAVMREGELLIPLTLPAGTTTLTLDYQW